jgi:predicted  nucleic acid-binding Zn-ribbon protein
MDVFDHFVMVMGAIGVAGVPSFFAARNHRELRAVKEQVTNGHADPMRVDLDRVIYTVGQTADAVEVMSRNLDSLREELRDEVTRRREGTRELRDDLERSRTERRESMQELRDDIDGKLTQMSKRINSDR